MWNASTNFDGAVKKSHNAIARLEIRSSGVLKYTTEEEDRIGLMPGGMVNVDRDADIRRTLSGLRLYVRKQSDFDTLLDPILGYTYHLARGIEYSDGTREFVPIGVFKINSYTLESRNGSLIFTGNGFDLAYTIANNKWRTPYKIATGTNYVTAMRDLMTNRTSGFTLTVNAPVTTLTTPDLFYGTSEDPWKAVRKLAQAIGCETYFDPAGVWTVMPIPDPLTSPVSLDLTASPEAVRIGELRRSGDLTDAYNGVICRASAPWLLFPISGEAWDNDANSPTYRYGSFGERPKTIEDATATTDSQCATIAAAELRKVLGKSEMIEFSSIVDPRIEVGDVVSTWDETFGVNMRHSLTSYSIPILQGTASGVVKTFRKV